VIVAKVRYGGAEGRSKKEAEQRAAEAAWREITARSAAAEPLTLETLDHDDEAST